MRLYSYISTTSNTVTLVCEYRVRVPLCWWPTHRLLLWGPLLNDFVNVTSEALHRGKNRRTHVPSCNHEAEIYTDVRATPQKTVSVQHYYSPSRALYSPPPVAWMIFLISSSSAIEPGSGLIDIFWIFFKCRSKPVLPLSVASTILVMWNSRIQVRQVSLQILCLENQIL